MDWLVNQINENICRKSDFWTAAFSVLLANASLFGKRKRYPTELNTIPLLLSAYT